MAFKKRQSTKDIDSGTLSVPPKLCGHIETGQLPRTGLLDASPERARPLALHAADSDSEQRARYLPRSGALARCRTQVAKKQRPCRRATQVARKSITADPNHRERRSTATFRSPLANRQPRGGPKKGYRYPRFFLRVSIYLISQSRQMLVWRPTSSGPQASGLPIPLAALFFFMCFVLQRRARSGGPPACEHQTAGRKEEKTKRRGFDRLVQRSTTARRVAACCSRPGLSVAGLATLETPYGGGEKRRLREREAAGCRCSVMLLLCVVTGRR